MRPGASLRSVEAFLAYMKSLAGGELRSLQEVVLKTDIKVFRNSANAAVLGHLKSTRQNRSTNVL